MRVSVCSARKYFKGSRRNSQQERERHGGGNQTRALCVRIKTISANDSFNKPEPDPVGLSLLCGVAQNCFSTGFPVDGSHDPTQSQPSEQGPLTTPAVADYIPLQTIEPMNKSNVGFNLT